MYLHILTSLISLAIGPFQFYGRFRQKYIKLHRIFGRIYTVCCVLGGIGSIGLSFRAFGGLVSTVGFLLLAFLWIGFTILAVWFIKYKKDYVEHRKWMIRSFSLTLSAVTIRIFIGIFVATDTFETGYPMAVWMCWVPNLLIAEYYMWYQEYCKKEE